MGRHTAEKRKRAISARKGAPVAVLGPITGCGSCNRLYQGATKHLFLRTRRFHVCETSATHQCQIQRADHDSILPRPTSTQLANSEGRRLYALEYRAHNAACRDAKLQERHEIAEIGREYLTNVLGADAFEGTADNITNEQLFAWLTPSGTEVELENVPLDEVGQWISVCRWAV